MKTLKRTGERCGLKNTTTPSEMAQSPILNRTNLASILYNDAGGIHIRVYYQDEIGDIHETCYDSTTGWTIKSDDIIARGACMNTGIAAVSWDSPTGRQVSIVYNKP